LPARSRCLSSLMTNRLDHVVVIVIHNAARRLLLSTCVQHHLNMCLARITGYWHTIGASRPQAASPTSWMIAKNASTSCCDIS
jgi:hypothetical protein